MKTKKHVVLSMIFASVQHVNMQWVYYHVAAYPSAIYIMGIPGSITGACKLDQQADTLGTHWMHYRELRHGQYQGAVSIRKTVLPGMAIPMLKIRRPNGRLIFNMEITIRR